MSGSSKHYFSDPSTEAAAVNAVNLLQWSSQSAAFRPYELLVYHNEPTAPLKDLSSALRASQILDDTVVEVPGSVVILPLGSSILRRYRQLLRKTLNDAQLSEYEYPFVLSTEVLKRSEDVIDLKDLVLHVGDDAAWATGKARWSLVPTGEATIYSHWAKILRTAQDLPMRAFQQGRYFRPLSSGKHSGGSVFKCLESCDVFEIHCAFLQHDEALHSISDLLSALKNLSKLLSIPTIWGERPRTFNRSEVSSMTIGGDSLLLSGGTVQTACVYDQGQIFSQAFSIRVRHGDAYQNPFHVTAAITRRLLYILLQLGLRRDKTIFVHPDVAPGPCLLVFKHNNVEPMSEDKKMQWRCALGQVEGRYCDVLTWNDALSYRQIINRAMRAGLPLLAVLRTDAGVTRLNLKRLDSGADIDLIVRSPKDLAAVIAQALSDIKATFHQATLAFARDRVVTVTSIEELVAASKARRIARCALSMDVAVLAEIARLRVGEVLSTGEGEERPCILSHRPVRRVAMISTRI